MNVKYRVIISEYERGWGSKPIDVRDFDSFNEANDYVQEENKKNNLPYVPDYYIRAESPFLIDLDRHK